MSYDVRASAFAKINLSLRVLGRRPDGYHELRTIFQSLALHDTITIRRERGPFRLECGDPDCPHDDTNLIWRAATIAWKAAGRLGPPRDIVIALVKRIPIAAGLGGGSSDAAATLRAVAGMWRIDPARLPRLAARLGADVPYFLQGGTVLGLERGDLLFSLAEYPSRWVTLVIPTFTVSTKDAYQWFDQDRKRGRAPFSGVMSAKTGYGAFFGNDLQRSVAKRHPEISRMIGSLHRAGASVAAMSGSGSAVFGLFARRSAAMRAADELATGSRRTLVTRTIDRAEYHALAAK